MAQRKNRGEGFTLVELLVVIGIIAVLTGILLPAVAGARRTAKSMQCMSNIRQWGHAFHMYASENKGVLPTDGDARFGSFADGPGSNADGDRKSRPLGLWNDSGLWINTLPKYVKGKNYSDMQLEHINGGEKLPIGGDNSVFVCPESSIAVAVSGEFVDAAGYQQMWGLIGVEGADYSITAKTGIDAGYFTGLPLTFGTDGVYAAAYSNRPAFICYALNSKLNSSLLKAPKMSQLRKSSVTVLMVEKRMQIGEIPKKVQEVYHTYMDNSIPVNDKYLETRKLARIKADWARFTGRHKQGGHLLFVDGHVAYRTMEDVTTPGIIPPAAANPKGDWNKPDLVWDPFGPAYPN